jgi:hypothetical protein
MKKVFLIFAVTIASCADVSDMSSLSVQDKSLRGSKCSIGCIWSTYAVTTGLQRLTHYCDGVGCHCVEEGNIYASCHDRIQDNSINSIDNNVIQENEYNSYKGNMIADEAYREASIRGTVGWCYNAVADAVERVTGPFLWGSHAYQSADQFATSSHFFEVWNVSLLNLPAGAIVVWGKGSSVSGHVSVSLGNGQEASDHISTQMTYHYGGGKPRVFYPK